MWNYAALLSLENTDLSNCYIDNEGLKAFSKVKKLSIGACFSVTANGLTNLKCIEDLEVGYCSMSITKRHVRFLSRCSNLTIYCTNITKSAIQGLRENGVNVKLD
jgi:hypothetical protein